MSTATATVTSKYGSRCRRATENRTLLRIFFSFSANFTKRETNSSQSIQSITIEKYVSSFFFLFSIRFCLRGVSSVQMRTREFVHTVGVGGERTNVDVVVAYAWAACRHTCWCGIRYNIYLCKYLWKISIQHSIVYTTYRLVHGKRGGRCMGAQ